MTNNKTLRAGLIGLGMMGRHHARNLQALEGVELVAVADPGGDPYGVAGDLEILPDAQALVEAGIDYAVVAVPTQFHRDVAVTFAEAGVHCLVEKPLAFDIGEADEIARLFEERALVGAVGYVERYKEVSSFLCKGPVEQPLCRVVRAEVGWGTERRKH